MPVGLLKDKPSDFLLRFTYDMLAKNQEFNLSKFTER